MLQLHKSFSRVLGACYGRLTLDLVYLCMLYRVHKGVGKNKGWLIEKENLILESGLNVMCVLSAHNFLLLLPSSCLCSLSYPPSSTKCCSKRACNSFQFGTLSGTFPVYLCIIKPQALWFLPTTFPIEVIHLLVLDDWHGCKIKGQ